MKLYRPHIPFEVRCRVAMRQLNAVMLTYSNIDATIEHSRGRFVELLQDELLPALRSQYGCDRLHLDHHPALENRAKVIVKGVHVGYLPDANDPDCLRYMIHRDHHIKTNVRGERGQFADNVIAKRERRRLKKLTRAQELKEFKKRYLPTRKKSARRPKPKVKILARKSPWPAKGSRPFRRR